MHVYLFFFFFFEDSKNIFFQSIRQCVHEVLPPRMPLGQLHLGFLSLLAFWADARTDCLAVNYGAHHKHSGNSVFIIILLFIVVFTL